MRLAPQGDYSQAMLPSIACKSTAEALPKMLARFEMGGAQSLGGFESAVYATPQRVLKLTHTLRRDPGQLEAELRQLRMDNDILKKASGLEARELS